MTAQLRSSRREPPPPAPGTVDIRIQGRPEDVAAALVLLDAVSGPGPRRLWRKPGVYPDRNGVTVRRYLTADLRDHPGPP